MTKITTLSATQMHQQRGAIIKRCFRDKEHFVIEKEGIPMVAIVPIDEYRRFANPSDTSDQSG